MLGILWFGPCSHRRPLKGKQRTSLSYRVATGISWSPLSGLKGVKPPLEFGETLGPALQQELAHGVVPIAAGVVLR